MKRKLLPFILLISCSGIKQNDEASSADKIPKDFFQIDIESIEGKKEVKKLSDIASKVEYVQLQTDKDCIVNAQANFLITDSLILVNNLSTVLKFSRDGKFLGQMCNNGRGPGENEGIASISIVPTKNLLAIQSSKKMLLYSLNGEFIRSFRTPPLTSSIFTDADRYIAYFAGGLGNEFYTFLLSNTKMDTIAAIKNNLRWRDNVPSSWWSQYPYFEPFYHNRNTFYAKSIYNDTVYYIFENSFIPGYFINLGKYKLPPEWRVERIMLQEPEKFEMMLEKETSCYYCNVFETGKNIFLTLVNFRTHKPKYFLIERGSGKNLLLVNENQEPDCFINDMDEGMNFWPKGKINDKLVYMTLNVMDLKNKLNHNFHDKQDSKLQENFKEMVSDIDISANPVIMLVTLK